MIIADATIATFTKGPKLTRAQRQRCDATPRVSLASLASALIAWIPPGGFPFLLKGTQALAQAQARPGQALSAGSGSGLKNLKPEPAQARPKPGISGQAGPWASLMLVRAVKRTGIPA
ncbi:hypothetical protein B0H13DRAFT_1860903 [Mycena leptocephala]|nr:hypothetical protein B0H13DRAFT_1860903 [Mycena leptocephala]